MKPTELSRARRIFLATFGLIVLMVAAIAPWSKVTVDFASFANLFYLAGLLIALAAYAHFRGMWLPRAASEIIGVGFLLTVAVLLLTYFVIAADHPLADAQLDAMDRALGFHWLPFIRFVDARPWLATMLAYAYTTISYQLILLPLVLVALKKPQRAYAMMTGYGILCVMSSAIAMYFPALGTYAYYGLDYGSVSNINPYFALSPVPAFNAVRDQASYTLALGSASGLLCFPSVHAGVACLATWAAWDVKPLRYPVLALNVAMSVAAVSHANHYFVDIIAGFGVAAFTTALVTALFYEHPLVGRLPGVRRLQRAPQPAE